ncbi:DNA mismatch repair protein MutS [Desulfoprunum benzoelyticum]|uniref:DNA mismatch repair protein MutS n=1 Tax=Desulfoprunum benzoelyticum TaxID=1506996 RepID=A0A840UMD9_9BACT|nr:DNA mismatch repair protein MutS [Desulfoprunum benzoelyticum]MBB5346942.1 DNA mismatch repair protein MutS [Desulfoprunum benzoelyticum]MBM9529396.1 DNA mismatch repair protein MutS [Desulfoprunum benzoelyticum]
MTTVVKMTPMLQQYLEIKGQFEDAILFYRMGDFYEMFFDDAITAAKVLGITLTSRSSKDDENRIPMCGVPFHSASGYLAKLIAAGHRVAICEQTEDPAAAKGIVKREVVRVLSPGVVTDSQVLDDRSNNYICALARPAKAPVYGLSFVDVSTGQCLVGEVEDPSSDGSLVLDQLTRLAPAEILLDEAETETLADLKRAITAMLPGVCFTERHSRCFSPHAATELLHEHFNVVTLDGFGCGALTSGIAAAAVIIEYVGETQKAAINHIEKLTPLDLSSYLQIDDASRRNLELTQTIIGGKREGSLLSVLDQTCTPMGARLLKHNLLFPLQELESIISRLNAVDFLYQHRDIREQLRALLSRIYDIERLNSRIMLGTCNGRDLLALRDSVVSLPDCVALLNRCAGEKFTAIAAAFDPLVDIRALLESAIHPEAPVSLREGNLIREGFNAELDELIRIQRDGRQLILSLEAKEREQSGVPKLKIGFNKVFGYYIEVSRVNLDKVPDHYIRKQTLVNAERFITPELKEFEGKVLGAEERRLELEYHLFCALRSDLAAMSERILATARALAEIDFLCSLAETARNHAYHRPLIDESDVIHIREGRHPVIERGMPTGRFVPNDILLDQEGQEVLIITGPNMAGKSTILRQTALIVLMAQMGSFVPADYARIGIVDRIFTRVGAMDDLRRGQSTFMVEMSETANILNNATSRSLVILDEIGRGTSTYDGLSIAWAVAEELAGKDDKGVKTLFATHYHELIDLALTQERVKNYSVAVREWNDSIIFLHKLIEGGTNKSYGIQVAGLAGVPAHVIQRAEEILKNIEQSEFDREGDPYIARTSKPKRGRRKTHPNQLPLFQPSPDQVREFIQRLSVDDLTPRQAMEALYTLKGLCSLKESN